jgi:hypothetical protein
MKVLVVTFTFLLLLVSTGLAQQWQTVVSLDSRIGYSTNTFLNSFLSEWNTTSESPYNITSIFGKTYWHKKRSSVSLTGGLYYEPIFKSSTINWRGGVALLDMNHRISDNFRLGFEGGGSYLNGAFSRSTGWIQPKATWFVSPFSLFRLKAGSNFRNYQNYTESGDSYNRFDLYSLEFETWPSYRWKLTAGLYGNLNTLPSIQEGFNSTITAGYYFRNGANLNLKTGLQQYQLSTTTTNGGGPPGGGGLPNDPTTTTATDTDRILRVGLDASAPVNNRVSVFSTVDMLYFDSEISGSSRTDYQASAGVRFSFEPQFNRSNTGITPEWEIQSSSQSININYQGEGQLYLVGTFNDWNKPGIPLTKQTKNTYVATLSLSPGAYEYRILRVQGKSQEWLDFSNETYTVDDGFDSENAMLLVE